MFDVVAGAPLRVKTRPEYWYLNLAWLENQKLPSIQSYAVSVRVLLCYALLLKVLRTERDPIPTTC